MVLRHEVEKIRCLLLRGRIKVLSAEGLVDGPERRLERAVLLIAEKRRIRRKLHLINEGAAVLVRERNRPRRDLRLTDALMIVVIEQVKRRRVGLHHIQDLLGIQRIGNALHHLDRLPELLQPLPVDGRAANKVIFQHTRRPTTELDTPLRMDAIADGDDDIEIIANNLMLLHAICHGAMASDMCKICTYHFWINFTFLYGVFDMFSNNRTILAEQFGHLCLRQPDGIAIR